LRPIEDQRNDKDVGSNDANIIESCQADDKNVDSNVDLNIAEFQVINDINIDKIPFAGFHEALQMNVVIPNDPLHRSSKGEATGESPQNG